MESGWTSRRALAAEQGVSEGTIHRWVKNGKVEKRERPAQHPVFRLREVLHSQGGLAKDLGVSDRTIRNMVQDGRVIRKDRPGQHPLFCQRPGRPLVRAVEDERAQAAEDFRRVRQWNALARDRIGKPCKCGGKVRVELITRCVHYAGLICEACGQHRGWLPAPPEAHTIAWQRKEDAEASVPVQGTLV